MFNFGSFDTSTLCATRAHSLGQTWQRTSNKKSRQCRLTRLSRLVCSLNRLVVVASIDGAYRSFQAQGRSARTRNLWQEPSPERPLSQQLQQQQQQKTTNTVGRQSCQQSWRAKGASHVSITRAILLTIISDRLQQHHFLHWASSSSKIAEHRGIAMAVKPSQAHTLQQYKPPSSRTNNPLP